MKHSKSNIYLFVLTSTLLCATNSASAVNAYYNNISAVNINVLSDTFMSYVNYGEKMSDLFERPDLYRLMKRVDEYGDNGSTIKTIDSESTSVTPLNDIWVDGNYTSAKIDYDHSIHSRSHFNLASVGTNLRPVELKYGNISFGGFASYINTKIGNIRGSGDAAGVFAHYKYHEFGTHLLANIGSLNNTVKHQDFNNSWVNVADDIYANLKLDETLYFKPSMYVGYTWVSSDDLYINNTRIASSDFHFLNLAPSVQFIKEITHNLYGTLSAKYVMHLLGDDYIHVGNQKIDTLDIDDHTDIGIDLEYHLNQFVFGGKVHKQLGDVNAWNFNLNVRYVF